jgi:1,2-diacylglycerol 3-alpha-glucosyltransferase
MKVTIVHNHPIHYKHLLFTELKRAGLDFDVLLQAGQSSIRHERIELSDELYRSQVAYPGTYEAAPWLTRVWFTWSKMIELRPDVSVISGYYAIECWMAWIWAKLHGRPIVLWYESNEFDYRRHWPLETLKRIFVKGCRRAHVYGHSNRAYLVKLGLPFEQIDIKRAVVDVDRFSVRQPRRPRSESRPLRLLYVGRLAPEKNLHLLLRAYARYVRQAAKPEMQLVLAGSGPSEAALRAEASALKIDHLVEFKGYTPQKSLGELYQNADFFILPSTREPWGLVALEAMLARLPVLISTQCGCAEDVVNGDTGWTFSPWDEEALTRLLLELPRIPQDRLDRMGEAAYAVAQEYSAPNCAAIIVKSLSQFARGRYSGRPAGTGMVVEAGQ